MFSERGLEVTLDDVAHRAGVGVGTVYRRYPSKQALAEALFVDKLDAVADLAERALANRDSWDALAGFLEQAAGLVSADRGLRQILMSATYATERIDQARARLQQVGTRLVERAQHDGAVRADLQPTDVPLIEFMLASRRRLRLARPARYLAQVPRADPRRAAAGRAGNRAARARADPRRDAAGPPGHDEAGTPQRAGQPPAVAAGEA